MSKETIVIEGVLKSLEGLAGIMATTSDTGENAELGVKIQSAIDAAVWCVVGDDDEYEDDDEQEPEPEFDIAVSKEAKIKTISWACNGWHTSYVGSDGVHYNCI